MMKRLITSVTVATMIFAINSPLLLAKSGISGVPDFTVDSFVPQSPANPGDNIKVNIKAENIGSSVTGGLYYSIYLSKPGSDFKNGRLIQSQALLSTGTTWDQGSISSATKYVTIPSDVNTGDYNLTILLSFIPQNNSSIESNLSNNFKTNIITIGSSSSALPDLKITDMGNSTDVAAGGNITIEAYIQNVGTGKSSGLFRIDWYLSKDNKLDNSDIRLDENYSGYYTQDILPGDKVQVKRINVRIPENIQAGRNYYIFGYVDAGNQIKESNENNNTSRSSDLLHIQASLSLSINPNTTQLLKPGESQTYDVSVSDNIGNRVAGAYVSVKNEITGENKSIQTDNNGNVVYKFTVPNDAKEGNYSITFAAAKNGYDGAKSDKVVPITIGYGQVDANYKVKLLRMFYDQSGLHVFANVSDKNGIGVDENSVKFSYKFLPNPGSKFAHGSSMQKVNGDIFSVNIPQSKIGDGDKIIWRIISKDKQGNRFSYPNDAKISTVVPYLDNEYQDWGHRYVMGGESNNRFTVTNARPSGAFTITDNGNHIKIVNNTAIWYSMDVISSNGTVSIDGNKVLGKYMPDPRTGLIPSSFDSFFGDRSTYLNAESSTSNIELVFNRKSDQAMIRNTWDMIVTELNPALKLENNDWTEIIDQANDQFDLVDAIKDLPKDDNSGELKLLDIITSKAMQNFLKVVIADHLVKLGRFKKLSNAIDKVDPLLGGAIAVLKGINKQILFDYDVFAYPDYEKISLVRDKPFSIEDGYVAMENNKIVSTDANSYNLNSQKEFGVKIQVPKVLHNPLFNAYADVKIYGPDGKTLLDSTHVDGGIEQGKVDVGIIDESENTGINSNMLWENDNKYYIPIVVKYDFNQSSTGVKYYSSTQPYFVQVNLYDGGYPGKYKGIYAVDTLVSSNKMPIYLVDNIPPNVPEIDKKSSIYDARNVSFGIKTTDKDINYYVVYYGNEKDTLKYNGREVLFYKHFDQPQTDAIFKVAAIDMGGNKSDLTQPIEFTFNKTYSISGKINGVNKSITLLLSGGMSPVYVNTNSDGTFKISGIKNGSYSLIPISDTYTFTPTEKKITINYNDLSGVSFSAESGSTKLPKVSTDNVTGVTEVSAILHGDYSDNGTNGSYYFKYGNDRNDLMKTEISSTSGSTYSFVEAQITGLKPYTTYYYVLIGEANGSIVSGDTLSFTTKANYSVDNVTLNTASSSVQQGSPITFTGKITGNGSGTVGYYLEKEKGSDWIKVGDKKQVDLENGSVSITNLTYVENDAGQFKYRIHVIEPNEQFSNQTTITIKPQPKPNIVINSVTLNNNIQQDVSSYPGDLLQVGFFIGNESEVGTSKSFYYSIFASTDSKIDKNDILLFKEKHSALDAESIHILTIGNFKLPDNIKAGKYHIGVFVDSDNEIDESNENDNIAWYSNQLIVKVPSKSLKISTTKPTDLAILPPDGSQKYTLTLHDQSDAPVAGAQVTVSGGWLTSSTTIDGTTDSQGQIVYTAKVPNDQKDGTYTLTFKAKKDGYQESDGVDRKIQVARPDLTISSVKLSDPAKADFHPSDPINLETVLGNKGKVYATAGFKVSYYLSKDKTLDNNDINIGEVKEDKSIQAGKDQNLSAQLNIPDRDKISDGTYYLIAKVNPEKTIDEEDYSNNTGMMGTTISVSPVPITQLTIVSLKPEGIQIVAPGSKVPYTLMVKDGNGNPVSGVGIQIHDGLSNTNITPQQKTDSKGSLAYSLQLDPKIKDGKDTLTFIASKDGYKESSAITRVIQITRPDLMVKSVTFKSDGKKNWMPGETLSVTTNLRNNGKVPVDGGFKVAYYISPNKTIDKNAIARDTVQINGPLGAEKDTVLSAVDLILPKDLPDGSYYVGVKVDVGSVIGEPNEDNNTGFSDSSFDVGTAKLLAKVTPESKQFLSPGDSLVYQVTVTDSKDQPVQDAIITVSGGWMSQSVTFTKKTDENGQVSHQIKIPQNIKDSSYTLTFTASEKDYQNSTGVDRIIDVTRPDLTVNSLRLADPARKFWQEGDSLALVAQIHNLGKVSTARGYSVIYYLSTDMTMDSNDVALDTVNVMDPLKASADLKLSQKVMIPEKVDTGSYYLGVFVDAYKNIDEEDETNNVAFTVDPIRIIERIQPVTISMGLGKGWQMVGIPIDSVVTSPKKVYQTLIAGTAYRFAGRYLNADSLIPGNGYWIRLNDTLSVVFNGIPIDTVYWKVEKGWNMVSGPSNKIPFNVSDYNPPLLSIWGYDGSYQSANQLQPGHAYWVFSNSDATVTVPKQQAKKTDAPLAAANTTTNQDMKLQSKDQAPPITLMVKDAAGHQIQLMVDGSQANGTSVPNRYLMPPLPPSGMFDARFSTGYQMANGKDAKVDMQGMKDGGSFSFSSKNDQTRLQLVISDPTGQNNADKILSPGQVYTLPSQSKISVRVHVTSVQEIKASLPKQFELKQNYPNPFNPTTTIRYGLPEKANVQLTVYNILGQKVESLVSGSQKAGWHQVRFDAHQLASGLYIYRLVAGDHVMVRKLMLVK